MRTSCFEFILNILNLFYNFLIQARHKILSVFFISNIFHNVIRQYYSSKIISLWVDWWRTTSLLRPNVFLQISQANFSRVSSFMSCEFRVTFKNLQTNTTFKTWWIFMNVHVVFECFFSGIAFSGELPIAIKDIHLPDFFFSNKTPRLALIIDRDPLILENYMQGGQKTWKPGITWNLTS